MPRLSVDPLASGSSLGPAVAIEALVAYANDARLDELAGVIADDATLTAALDGSTTDTVGLLDRLRWILARVPDLRQSIDWVVAVDERTAVACLAWSGTLPEARRPFRAEGVVLKVTLDDDRRVRAAWIFSLDPTMDGCAGELGRRGG